MTRALSLPEPAFTPAPSLQVEHINTVLEAMERADPVFANAPPRLLPYVRLAFYYRSQRAGTESIGDFSDTRSLFSASRGLVCE